MSTKFLEKCHKASAAGDSLDFSFGDYGFAGHPM